MSEVTDTSTPADNRTTHEVVAFIEQHARMGAGHTALWRGAIARLNSHDALVAALEKAERGLLAAQNHEETIEFWANRGEDFSDCKSRLIEEGVAALKAATGESV
jgi:hypothetical protein